MNLKRWLFLSVTLNAALAVVLFTRPQPAPVAAAAVPVTNRPVAEAPPIKVGAPAGGKELPAGWVQTLRNGGISEKLIASVAAADYETRWQRQLAVMKKKFARGEISETEFSQFLAAHDAAEESELRASLGEGSFRQWDKDKVLRDFDTEQLKLSDADSDSLYQLQKDLDRQRHDLEVSKLNGEVDEATLEQQTEAKQDEYEKKLKSLLGDSRYASLQAGDSAVGNLRRSLAKVNASDEQVDAMLKGQQRWQEARAKVESELHDGKVTAQEYEQQIKTVDAARDQLYQQTLGPDAYADLQKNQDTRYQTMQRYASAWNLSDNDINHLYGAIQSYETSVRDYQQRAKEVEARGTAVDWDAVQKILRDFNQQTEQALQKYLGDDRFNQLKQGGALNAEP